MTSVHQLDTDLRLMHAVSMAFASHKFDEFVTWLEEDEDEAITPPDRETLKAALDRFSLLAAVSALNAVEKQEAMARHPSNGG